MQEYSLESYDKTPIYVTLWDDVEMPKGVVMILHGMGEYAGFYDRFARFLNSRGYIVFADDHRAHGRTETDETRGRHKGNIFKKTVRDELFFMDMLEDKYRLPIFLLGHSYGSFLCQALAQTDSDAKAIALVGSGYMRAKGKLGGIVLAPLALIAGNWRPKLTRKISDNHYHYPGDSGKMQWLNSLPERREELTKDKYMRANMSVNFSYHMLREVGKLYSRKAKSKLDPTVAIGIFSGIEDPIGGYGKGVIKLNQFYKSVGVKSELHLYNGARHDVLYDRCETKVQNDIADFFDRFVIYHQTSIEELLK